MKVFYILIISVSFCFNIKAQKSRIAIDTIIRYNIAEIKYKNDWELGYPSVSNYAIDENGKIGKILNDYVFYYMYGYEDHVHIFRNYLFDDIVIEFDMWFKNGYNIDIHIKSDSSWWFVNGLSVNQNNIVQGLDGNIYNSLYGNNLQTVFSFYSDSGAVNIGNDAISIWKFGWYKISFYKKYYVNEIYYSFNIDDSNLRFAKYLSFYEPKEEIPLLGRGRSEPFINQYMFNNEKVYLAFNKKERGQFLYGYRNGFWQEWHYN